MFPPEIQRSDSDEEERPAKRQRTEPEPPAESEDSPAASTYEMEATVVAASSEELSSYMGLAAGGRPDSESGAPSAVVFDATGDPEQVDAEAVAKMVELKPRNIIPNARLVAPARCSLTRGLLWIVHHVAGHVARLEFPSMGMAPARLARFGLEQFSLWEYAPDQRWPSQLAAAIDEQVCTGATQLLWRIFDPTVWYVLGTGGEIAAVELVRELLAASGPHAQGALPLAPRLKSNQLHFVTLLYPEMIGLLPRFFRIRKSKHAGETWARFAASTRLLRGERESAAQVRPEAIIVAALALAGAHMAFTGQTQVEMAVLGGIGKADLALYRPQFAVDGTTARLVFQSELAAKVQTVFDVIMYDVFSELPDRARCRVYRTEDECRAFEAVDPAPEGVKVDVLWSDKKPEGALAPTHGLPLHAYGFSRWTGQDLMRLMDRYATPNRRRVVYLCENFMVPPVARWNGLGKATVAPPGSVSSVQPIWATRGDIPFVDATAAVSLSTRIASFRNADYQIVATHVPRILLAAWIQTLLMRTGVAIDPAIGLLNVQLMCADQALMPELYKGMHLAWHPESKLPNEFGVVVENMAVVYDLSQNVSPDYLTGTDGQPFHSYQKYLDGIVVSGGVPLYRVNCDLFRGVQRQDIPNTSANLAAVERIPRNAVVHCLEHGSPPAIARRGVLVIGREYDGGMVLAAAMSCLSLIIVQTEAAIGGVLPLMADPHVPPGVTPWYMRWYSGL